MVSNDLRHFALAYQTQKVTDGLEPFQAFEPLVRRLIEHFCYSDDVIFWWRNSVTFIMYLVIMLHYDRSIDAMKYGTMTHSCYIIEFTDIRSLWITIILMKSLILTSISTAFFASCLHHLRISTTMEWSQRKKKQRLFMMTLAFLLISRKAKPKNMQYDLHNKVFAHESLWQ